MSLHLGGKRPRRRYHLWHVPVQQHPFGTQDAWPTAAQLRQGPAGESRAPVLPWAAWLCQPDGPAHGAEQISHE